MGVEPIISGFEIQHHSQCTTEELYYNEIIFWNHIIIACFWLLQQPSSSVFCNVRSYEIGKKVYFFLCPCIRNFASHAIRGCYIWPINFVGTEFEKFTSPFTSRWKPRPIGEHIFDDYRNIAWPHSGMPKNKWKEAITSCGEPTMASSASTSQRWEKVLFKLCGNKGGVVTSR